MHFFEYLTNWRFHHITIIDARRTRRRRKWLRWRNVKIGTLLQKKNSNSRAHIENKKLPIAYSEPLSGNSISPTPLNKRQVFTVSEQNTRYCNGLEENAPTRSGEDLAKFPYTACSTPQQYKADCNLYSACTASATNPGYESKSEQKAKEIIPKHNYKAGKRMWEV